MKVEGLAADLERFVQTHTEPTVTLRAILLSLGDRGFGLLLVILSLPSAMPVPAPGYSTPFGLLMATLGIQLLIGRSTPSLPSKTLDREFQTKNIHRIFTSAIRFFHKTEALLRPRLRFMSGKTGGVLTSLLVIVMACLMILPIPLTNTLPAMVIFLVGLAMIERDGLALIAAALLGWVAIAAYGAAIYAVYFLGSTSFEQIKELLKGLFQLG